MDFHLPYATCLSSAGQVNPNKVFSLFVTVVFGAIYLWLHMVFLLLCLLYVPKPKEFVCLLWINLPPKALNIAILERTKWAAHTYVDHKIVKS